MIFENKFFDITLILCIIVTLKLLLFRFVPKKSREIYKVKLAHRGFHMLYPENTIEAYNAAIDANMGIEMDIRFLADGNIVCFHDRYTKRLLNVPGKLTMLKLHNLKKLFIKNSKCKVPTLKEALKAINGRTVLLIEVKGNVTKKQIKSLRKIVYSRNNTSNGSASKTYFHAKNVLTYFRLKKVFGDRVFYILNPFRKRMKFIKGKDYKLEEKKYFELLKDIEIEIPYPEDLMQIIAQSIQSIETKKEILASIGEIINKYETRIGKNHWVNKSLWLHRGIISDKYLEHSRESFLACIEFARKNNILVTVEFDVMLYKGKVRCYHKDSIPSLLGQDKSCAEKLQLESTLELSEILEIFAGHEEYINLAIDIKDYHLKNRTLSDMIINSIESSNFKGNLIIMSYNPLVLNYFKSERKDILRAQIGHSLSGLRKVPFFRFPWILNGILGILFDVGYADCILFDNSEWIFWMIAYHRNITGKPVLIYAPKSYIEIEAFIGKESISNFIIENAENVEAWGEDYLKKYKKK